jgi:benzoylformate decarboxylase
VNAMRGFAAQTDRFVAMDLVEPEIDYIGLARSLGVSAERADTVDDAVDLLKKGLSGGAPLLIDVALDRAFKPV